jgi:hypothetical protein
MENGLDRNTNGRSLIEDQKTTGRSSDERAAARGATIGEQESGTSQAARRS